MTRHDTGMCVDSQRNGQCCRQTIEAEHDGTMKRNNRYTSEGILGQSCRQRSNEGSSSVIIRRSGAVWSGLSKTACFFRCLVWGEGLRLRHKTTRKKDRGLCSWVVMSRDPRKEKRKVIFEREGRQETCGWERCCVQGWSAQIAGTDVCAERVGCKMTRHSCLRQGVFHPELKNKVASDWTERSLDRSWSQ